MDTFPLPAANGAVRANGTKPPQGDSGSDAATLFAGWIAGENPVDANTHVMAMRVTIAKALRECMAQILSARNA